MVIVDNTENKKSVMLENGDTIVLIKSSYGWVISKHFAGLRVPVNQYDYAIAKRTFDITQDIYEN